MNLRQVKRTSKISVALFGVLLFAGIASPLPARALTQQQAPASAGEHTAPNGAVPEKEQEAKDENYEYTHSPTVEKLGAMLGMSPNTASTAFTVFNFLVLAVALAYFLLKALPKTFRNRNTAIQKHLVDARTATEEATARLNAVEDRLGKLDEQIAAMKAHAESDLAREEHRLKEGLEDEKLKIVQAAEAEILSATATARREIQQYAAELAIDQAARKLVVNAETDRLLVENFARRLGADVGGRN
jgi:F-type H+-transporting ATPase subunit b